MGANTHMQGVFSHGYVACATALGITVAGIDPLPGYRVAVSNFGYNNGDGGKYVCFHKVFGYGTVAAAGRAAGEASVFLTSSAIFTTAPGAGVTASACFVTIQLANGKYQHVYLNQYWASNLTLMLSTALIASVAGGATVWSYQAHGVIADNMCYQTTVASEVANVMDYGGPGIFYGKAPGDPMIVTMGWGSQIAAINYVNGQYITA